MSWTYTGDPSSSEKDRYRFIVGDTNEREPILQDGEIEFVLAEHSEHNTRLYHLYSACATFFARRIKRKVGPIEEEPLERQRYFEAKAAHYKSLINFSGFTLPKETVKPLRKGMHDNV